MIRFMRRVIFSAAPASSLGALRIILNRPCKYWAIAAKTTITILLSSRLIKPKSEVCSSAGTDMNPYNPAKAPGLEMFRNIL